MKKRELLSMIAVTAIAVSVFWPFAPTLADENSWSSGGPYDASVYSIAIHPFDNQRLYIGTLENFIFETTDGGAEWSVMEDTLDGTLMSRTVRVVKIHPFGPDTMFVATVRGAYKSTDAGQTWFQMFPQWPIVEWFALEVNREDPPVLFLGTWGSAWRSTDGGQSWTQMAPDDLRGGIEPIIADPVRPNIIYLGNNSATDNESIWKSTDSGITWRNIHNNLQYGPSDRVYASGIAVDPVDPDIIYFSRKDSNGIGEALVKSTNGGDFWTDITPPGLNFSWLYGVAVLPIDHNIVFVGTDGNGTLRSFDGGETWEEINEGISCASSRAESVVVDSATGIIYLGRHSGGIYRSTDNGDSWEKISYNITGAQCYDIAANWRHPDTLYTATKGGLYISADGAQSWDYVELNLPDYYARIDNVEVDPYDPSYVYVSHYYMTDQGWRGVVYRSTDGGANWESFGEGLLPGRCYTNIKVADHGDGARRLFMGSTEGLFYSDNLGESWALCGGGLPPGIRCDGGLDVSPIDPNLVYTSHFPIPYAQCHLYKSTDGGESWERLINVPEGEIISEIACDPINPAIVYVSVGWEAGLFKSTDGGQSWEDINNNLPRDDDHFFTNGLAINPLNHDNLFIYSYRRGLFQSHDSGQNWEDFFNEGSRATAYVTRTLIDPIDTTRVFLATNNSVWSITRTMVGIDDDLDMIPVAFSTSSYPNPFNPSTTIEYNLPEQAFVTVDIYDLLGRKVERLIGEDQQAGRYRVIWDAKNQASGLYYYKINAERYSQTGIMTLLK